jgi:hypothetical protein
MILTIEYVTDRGPSEARKEMFNIAEEYKWSIKGDADSIGPYVTMQQTVDFGTIKYTLFVDVDVHTTASRKPAIPVNGASG